MSIEEMQAELKAAGHEGIWVYYGNVDGFCFNFDNGIEITDMDKDEAIKKAYAHLQREKRYAEMEALLREMLAYAESPLPKQSNGLNQLWAVTSAKFMGFISQARKILSE